MSCRMRTPMISCGTFRSRGLLASVPTSAFPSRRSTRLYVLCCLAHEQRPQLGERDVRFLRSLGEAIVAELETRRPTVRT